MTTNIRAGADASATRLARVRETEWGITPATPAFTKLRFTGETLRPSKQTERSNEVRQDRNITDEVLVGIEAAGDISFEMADGAFDDVLEALMWNTWEGSPATVLKNGYETGYSDTVERTLLLPDGSSEYHRFRGLLYNTASIRFEAGRIATGTFGCMAKEMVRAAAAISGATYQEADQSRVMNAADDFASLAITGISPSPLVRAITLNINNNLRRQAQTGSTAAAGIGSGRFEVTGNVEAYFRTGAQLQTFLDHTDLVLSWVIGSTSGARYQFELPTVVPVGDPGSNAEGNDRDVMANFGFTAVLDRTSSPLKECTLQITRDF